MKSEMTTAVGSVLDVREARLVVLHDVWSGYSHRSPITAVYELRRTARGGLAGEGRLSTGQNEPKTVRVAMKSATAKAFLGVIASAPLAPAGAHAGPEILVTDSYPHVEIALHVGPSGHDKAGFALLHTRSQSEFGAPWSAFIDGVAYAIVGDEIGRALQSLDRTLKRVEQRRP
jgi:hypothetical protein